MTGAVLLNLLLHLFAGVPPFVPAAALALTLAGWGWKVMTWAHNDGLDAGPTLNSATGLKGGTVRSIEWPHTGENYILKEMGFRIARKHGRRLRLIAQGLAFLVPATAIALGFAVPAPWAAILSAVAACSQFCGMLVERWLFFAEAKHTVTLYYGY